jgi:hypothetical protein
MEFGLITQCKMESGLITQLKMIKIVPESLMTLKSGVPNTTIIHYKYTSSIHRKAEE